MRNLHTGYTPGMHMNEPLLEELAVGDLHYAAVSRLSKLRT